MPYKKEEQRNSNNRVLKDTRMYFMRIYLSVQNVASLITLCINRYAHPRLSMGGIHLIVLWKLNKRYHIEFNNAKAFNGTICFVTAITRRIMINLYKIRACCIENTVFLQQDYRKIFISVKSNKQLMKRIWTFKRKHIQRIIGLSEMTNEMRISSLIP